MFAQTQNIFYAVGFEGGKTGPAGVIAPFGIVHAVLKLHSLKPDPVIGQPGFSHGCHQFFGCSVIQRHQRFGHALFQFKPQCAGQMFHEAGN